MGADGRHGVAAPVRRGQRRPVRLAREPEQVGAHDPAGRQVAADPVIDRAEILADRQRPGPRRLARERGHRGPVVVAEVGAAVGRHPLRHAPQPHQPHHVVDPQPARAAQRRGEQVGQRLVTDRGQPPRVPRRLRPVLPALVELVRRRAHRQAADQQVLVRPGIRPAGVRPHGQVRDDPRLHARGERGPLRGGQLLVGVPLQPGVEIRGIRPGPSGRPSAGHGAGVAGRRRPRTASRARSAPRERTRWPSPRARGPRGRGSARIPRAAGRSAAPGG